MARTPREARFETREARTKIKARKEPHWRQIMPGTFLGYAKGLNGASWIARQRSGEGYRSQRIGTPDDYAPADGDVVLTYGQAVRRTTEIQVEARTPLPRHYADGETLDALVEAYIGARSVTPGGRTGRVMSARAATNTRQLWARHSGTLGPRLVTSLNAKVLRDWHVGLASTPPTKRGKILELDLGDEDQVSARRLSANRVLTIVKAALQFARSAELLPDALPDFWRRVQPFRSEDRGPPRMLSREEVVRLLKASPLDLQGLVTAALMTGARYGDLALLKVRDYSPSTGTVRLPGFKTGKGLTQPLTPEGIFFFTRVTEGRPANDLILTREGGGAWTTSATFRPLKRAAEKAQVDDVSIKVMRATYGKLLLLATRDLELVAKALGHSDSRITRKHYAALLPGEVAAGISQMPALGLTWSSTLDAT